MHFVRRFKLYYQIIIPLNVLGLLTFFSSHCFYLWTRTDGRGVKLSSACHQIYFARFT